MKEEILRTDYWSKSEAFLLPLTGLSKTQKYTLSSFLYWEEYNIEDFKLILQIPYSNYLDFVRYCKRVIFPVLDKNGYLIEAYDFENQSIFILDISEWALDIEMFLKGKYSKMSREAKGMIIDYHTFHDKGPKIPIEIRAALDPNDKYEILDNMTAIAYVAKEYGLNLEELKKIGEIASKYDEEKETLSIKTKTSDENYL